MESGQLTESAVPVKRKRGRPRRHPAVQPQAESNARLVVKDSRTSGEGSSVCVPDENNVSLSATPRRRGRPKKNPEKSESLSADQGSSPGQTQLKAKQQYTCVHCGVVKDYAHMSLHMLQEHYRVWDPSNPEGVVNLLRVIKRFGKLVCKKCQKQFNSAQYYTYHCKWCGREDERAICPVCNTSQKAMWLHAHVLAHKRKEKNTSLTETSISSDRVSQKKRRKAAERALEHIKDLDADIQEDSKFKKEPADNYKADSEEGSDDDDYASDSGSSTENRRISVRKVGFRKYTEFPRQAHRLTKEYYTKLADVSVLPSCLPVLNGWKPLSHDMAEAYLPKEMTSIKFEVCSATENKDLEEPLQLDFGESCDIDDGFIAYCGGAIWGLDWCPTPEAGAQYLAVACHRDFDHVTVLDQPTVGPGMVQIWNLGQLKFRSKCKSKSNLEFIIALDDGVILDLKWCPVGGWIKTDESTKLDRIGLLAVATSSGLIHIYSIPLPSRLNKETSGPLKVYNIEPIKTFCQNFLSQPDSPCLCLTWFVNSEITRLAGGFADGTISVWNPSSLVTLQSEKSKTADKVVRPFLTFLAHGSSVTGVDFCPSSGDFLVSCGYERNVRHWDLREPDSPCESCQLRSKLQSVCWSPFFPVVFTASDQCYAVNSTATYCVENSQVNLGYINLYLHDGCAWDVGYSRWTNALVSCDVVGDVTWMSLPYISNCKVQQKTFAKRRKNLMRVSKKCVSDKQTDTSLRPPMTCPTDEKNSAVQSECSSEYGQSDDDALFGTKKFAKDKTEHDTGSLQNGSLKRPWKDNLKRYVLNITFFDKEGPPADLHRELKPLDDMVQSLNRVVFSPNLSCCSWVACGGQAGLLFVKNIPALASKIL